MTLKNMKYVVEFTSKAFFFFALFFGLILKLQRLANGKANLQTESEN